MGTSGPAHDQGAPTVAEGEILPAFPGVAFPLPPPVEPPAEPTPGPSERTSTGAPAAGWTGVPAVGAMAKAEEAQPEPAIADDAAGGASNKDTSELETKDKVGAGEIEEREDLFASGSEDNGGGAGAEGAGDAPANMAE